MNRLVFESSDKGCFEEYSSSNYLLVSFGGIEHGIGVPIFEFYNGLKGIECDKVFFRDLNQMWYQKGVDAEIDSISKITNKLKSIIESKKYKRVLFLGNSMGGYAAILFGLILKVDAVLAFAPQTFIDKKSRFLNKDRRWAEQLNNVHSNKRREEQFFNLKKWMKTNNNENTHIEIYVSSVDKLDVRHIKNIQHYTNISIKKIEDGGHRVVKSLRDNGKLNEILTKWLGQDV